MLLFISYAHMDKDAVNQLVEVLHKGGHTHWIDTMLKSGQEWQPQLHQAIVDSDTVVLGISPKWLGSPYCMWEFVTAIEQGKKVIPVLLKKEVDSSYPKLPEAIGKVQWADFTEGFQDEERIQKFLRDILTLGEIIAQERVRDISKPTLEKDVSQAIQTGDLQGSNFRASQKAADKVTSAAQTVTIGDALNSTIVIDQSVNHGQRSRLQVILIALVLVVTVIILAGVALSLSSPKQKEAVLQSVGLSAPTEAPTLVRMPAGQFNVAVAGFGLQQQDGSVIENTLADDMSDIVLNAVSELPQVKAILGRNAPGVGSIVSDNSKERERQAAKIAETVNASVVIYGVVKSSGLRDVFEPEFYVTANFAALEPELIGGDKLGSPVEFLSGSTDQITASTDVQKRLKVLRFFLQGLSSYFTGNFKDSVDAFEQAIEAEPEGLEVLNVFAGNAATREPDSQQALEFYNAALKTRPDYARALVGRGVVLYQMAREKAGKTPPPYDPSLKLDSGHRCTDVDIALPDSPQLLAELSLRCYNEADRSTDKPATADIDVKTAFGSGQVEVWLSLNHYGDRWDDAQSDLQEVLALYSSSEPERQARIRAATAHANAWSGLRLLSIAGSDGDSVKQAADYYQTAVNLLKEDINVEYNQQWIDLYTKQYNALEDWLDEHKTGIAPLPTLTTTPKSVTPTVVPMPNPTLEEVG